MTFIRDAVSLQKNQLGARRAMASKMRLNLKTDVRFAHRVVQVSTVDISGYSPNFYETMVFAYNEDGTINYKELGCERWGTREDAEAGHLAIVRKWSQH